MKCLRYLILSKLDNGISGNRLAQEYNVSNSTITYIKKHRPDILNAVAANFDDAQNCKRMTENRRNNVEKILYEWILKQHKSNITLDNKTLKNKAKEIYVNINPLHAYKFKAGDKWLRNFKHRYGLIFLASAKALNGVKNIQQRTNVPMLANDSIISLESPQHFDGSKVISNPSID